MSILRYTDSAEFVRGSNEEIDLEILGDIILNISFFKFPYISLLICVTLATNLPVFTLINYAFQDSFYSTFRKCILSCYKFYCYGCRSQSLMDYSGILIPDNE